MRPSLALVAILAFASACGTSDAPGTVDGWALGAPAEFQVEGGCDRQAEYLAPAIAALDQDEHGHAPILEQRLYNPREPVFRSGGQVMVAVLRLADGSAYAIGVGRIGIGGIVAFDAPDKPRLPGGTAPEEGPCGPQAQP